MAKITAIARIHSISAPIKVNDTFTKRELILDESWEKDGVLHPSFTVIEFINERGALLDSFQPGQMVKVDGNLRSRDYNGKWFHDARGVSILPYQPTQAAPAYQQPQQNYQLPPQTYQQSPQYAGGNSQAMQSVPTPAQPQGQPGYDRNPFFNT